MRTDKVCHPQGFVEKTTSIAFIIQGCFGGMSLMPIKRRASRFSELLTETKLHRTGNRRYFETSSMMDILHYDTLLRTASREHAFKNCIWRASCTNQYFAVQIYQTCYNAVLYSNLFFNLCSLCTRETFKGLYKNLNVKVSKRNSNRLWKWRLKELKWKTCHTDVVFMLKNCMV